MCAQGEGTSQVKDRYLIAKTRGKIEISQTTDTCERILTPKILLRFMF